MNRLTTYFSYIQQWSIMSRLLLFFTLFSFIIWTSIGIVTWLQGKEHINTFFDTQQILFAKTLATTHFEPANTHLPNTENLLYNADDRRKGEEDDDVLAFAVFSASGQTLLTDGENGRYFIFTPPTVEKQGFMHVLVDDDMWRIFWLYSTDGQRVVAVGQEIEYRQDMAWDILLGQLMPWIVSLPLLLGALAWVLYRELAPLRNVTHALAVRAPDDTCSLALPSSSQSNSKELPPEIRPLVNALNALFLRTGEALRHERAFVANAAHELRTPLAGLTVQAEVITMCDYDIIARKHALQKLLEGTQRCTRLVDQLLLLSSLDAKQSATQAQSVQEYILWDNILPPLMKEAQEEAQKKSIYVHYTIHALPPTQKGLPELWGIAIRNLLDNAIRYTKQGGEVRLSLYKTSLCVENSATHIPAHVLPQLGQRFFRPPGQNSRGTGLGIAIVQHISALHKAKFLLENCTKGEQKTFMPTDVSAHMDGVMACICFTSKP